MKDRVSTYPGRVTLTPVSGESNTYDMVRADKPTEVGTPLSKANLLKDSTAAALGLNTSNNPTVNDALSALSQIKANNAGAHNSVYRGAALGTEVTTAQLAAIKLGTFKNMYIGDYWTIGGYTWRIAAFDYYLGKGDLTCEEHHVVVVPDECLYSAAAMDEGAVGAATLPLFYTGTAFRTDAAGNYTHAAMLSTVETAFGDSYILPHRIRDGSSFFDGTVELMTEQMVYGHSVFSVPASTSTEFTQGAMRVEQGQLPLFALCPSRIPATYASLTRDTSGTTEPATYWLRDTATSSSPVYFSCVDEYGASNLANSEDTNGIRPCFCLYNPNEAEEGDDDESGDDEEEGSSGTSVTSVNGYTGEVELTAEDVGALPTTGGTVNGSVTLNGGLTMGKQKGITLDGGVLSFSPSDSDGFYITKNEDYSGEAAVAFYGSDADQPVLLTNVADPEEDDNAANKLYVDGLVANAVGAYGVPNGGIEGQVLAKASGEDQDVTWVTVSASGSGSGSDGRGISGIVDYYAVSDNPITAPTQWADIPVPPTAEMKYAWHYQVITYTDGTTYTGAAHVIGVYGETGEPGEDGADGGYYTPVATQPDSNTLRLSYTPSDDTMPAVDPVDIALPGGSTLPFYTCSSSASSATKTLTGDQELPTDSGTLFAVNFAFANTSSAPVLVHDDTSLTVIRAGQSQSFSAQNLDAGVHLFLVLSGAYALLLNPNYGM